MLDLADMRRAWTAACMAFAAVALGAALQVRDGLVAPAAIGWLSVAIFGAFAGYIRLPNHSGLLRRVGNRMTLILAAGLGLQFLQHLGYAPQESWHGSHSTVPYYVLLAIAAGASALAIVSVRPSLAFHAAIFAFALLGAWLLTAGPKPRMDVWAAQNAGLTDALHGRDPWSSSFPDLYGKPDLYAPGTVRDGRTYLGFPYPPLTLLIDLPGHLVGDYRWSNLAAMVGAALLIGHSGRTRASKLAALLFLFTPRALLVLRNGWTEPQLALLLAAVVFVARRRPAWTPYFVGLLLASKQYMFIAIAPAALLLPREKPLAWIGKAAAAGLVVSLPLIAWNPRAYVHANFAAASGAAFRYDAMSFFALWADTHAWTPPVWIGWVCLVAAVPVSLLALRRSEKTAAGFAAAFGLVSIVFFALNKFAFCNYYYLVIAGLCASAGSSDVRERAAPAEPVAPTTPEAPRYPRLAAA